MPIPGSTPDEEAEAMGIPWLALRLRPRSADVLRERVSMAGV